mgnify:CR=1 FL=1
MRDTLLGYDVKDIDLATTHSPDDLLAMAKQAGFKTILSGIDHGTVRFIVDHDSFEITTLRSDLSTDGRHAKVCFTQSWEDDAARRDFTCNALFLDLEGNLHDYFGGMKDLRQRHLRFIGNPRDRLQEDYLRCLRYFRFFARFATASPDSITLQALKESRPFLKYLSKERLTYEIKGLLNHPAPQQSLSLMKETQILRTVLGDYLRYDLLSSLLDLEKQYSLVPSWIVRLACLFFDTPKQASLFLALSKHQKNLLNFLHKQSISPDSVDFLLYNYDTETVYRCLVIQKIAGHSFSLNKAFTTVQSWSPIAFPLTGKDALALGLKGKDIGIALNHVLTWWLQKQRTPGKEECLTHLEKVSKKQ